MASRTEHRSADEIRRDIERTRGEMDRTIDALEQRLSPGQLAEQALGAFKRQGRGIGDVVRDHPVPLSLMGLGVAWLAAEEARGDGGSRGAGTYGRAEGRVGPYRGDAVSEGDWAHDRGVTDRVSEKASEAADTLREKASETGATLKAKASNAAETVREKTGSPGEDQEREGWGQERGGARDRAHKGGEGGEGGERGEGERARETVEDARERAGKAAHQARERMSEVGDRAGEAAHHAREQAARQAQRARSGILSFLEDSPLAAGAISFGLGLASGLAAPTTRWEDEAMGETADTLKHRARETAEDVGRGAKHAAEDAARAAKEEADREGIGDDLRRMGDDLGERARRVAAEAKEAGTERAREEGLTREGMEERAREAGEATRDTARDQAQRRME